jgi:hypothetical protein
MIGFGEQQLMRAGDWSQKAIERPFATTRI